MSLITNNTDQHESSSSSSCETSEGNEPSHPPLPQLSLRDSFIQAGSRLQCCNPELFANAILQLSSQFSLAVVKNPEVLCSSTEEEQRGFQEGVQKASNANGGQKIVGHKRCKRDTREAEEEEEKGEEGQEGEGKRSCYRKYTLPGDANEMEYYQCMICKEQRHTNSFHAGHVHLGQKPKIRWYCPLCNDFFAVTHRSGHIKKRHSVAAECSSSSSSSSPSSSTNFYVVSSQEAIERRVAMIATAAAAAVVSAATTNKTTTPEADTATTVSSFCPPSVASEPVEEEPFYAPARKRVCGDADDQATVYSAFSSNTMSPVSEFTEDVFDCFSAEDGTSSSSSFPLLAPASPSCMFPAFTDSDTFFPNEPSL